MFEYEIRLATRVEPAILHEAFREAFSDYLIGPFTLALAQWPQFLARHAVDLSRSRAAVHRGEVLAFSLVAPRPQIGAWRLATMGAVPAARGGGAAPELLDDFIARAAAAGMQWAELECFAQNERALRLYRGRGFEAISLLYGYVRNTREPRVTPAADADVQTIELGEAYAFLDAASAGRRDLPLQVTPVSLKAGADTLHAMRSGDAVIVYAENAPELLTIQSLVDTDPAQRDAQALVTQLVEDHPRHRIVVPQLQRPDVGGDALERLGFVRQPLHQLLMRKVV